jgi:hypothetical protein
MEVPGPGYPEGGSEERGGGDGGGDGGGGDGGGDGGGGGGEGGGGRADLTTTNVDDNSQATKSGPVSSSGNVPSMPFPFPKPSNDSIVGELGGLSLDSLHIEDIENPQTQHAPYKNQIFRSPNSSTSSIVGESGKQLESSFISDTPSLTEVPKVVVVSRPRQGNRLGGFAKWAEAKRAKVHPDIPEDFIEAQSKPEDIDPLAEADREDSMFGEELGVDNEFHEPLRYQVNYNGNVNTSLNSMNSCVINVYYRTSFPETKDLMLLWSTSGRFSGAGFT